MAGLLDSLTPQAAMYFNYTGTPVVGSGIRQVINYAKAMSPKLLSDETLTVVIPELPNIFGGYPFPHNKGIEQGPSGLFIGVFAVLAIASFYITFRNFLRGHNFFLLIGLGWFCLFKVIGYACRLAWNNSVIRLNIGICSIVFIQVAQLVLLALNKVLAHRIFTWRHPETGNAWWVNLLFNTTYLLVLGLIAMAIVGEALPFIYFLGPSSWTICQNVMQAAGVLNVVYALLPFFLLFGAWVFKPGQLGANPFKRRRNDENLPPVVQPYWIESASPFFFPAKGAARKIYRGTRAAEAIRIMPSREPPAHGLHENHYKPMNPNSPRIRVAVITVAVGTFTLVLNTCFRCASTFQRNGSVMLPGTLSYRYWASHPYVAFIFYGATEALVLAMYLWMRIDLRFYIPDMARKRSNKDNALGDESSVDVDEPMHDEPKEYLEENTHV